jgi:hypothetical protein
MAGGVAGYPAADFRPTGWDVESASLTCSWQLRVVVIELLT